MKVRPQRQPLVTGGAPLREATAVTRAPCSAGSIRPSLYCTYLKRWRDAGSVAVLNAPLPGAADGQAAFGQLGVAHVPGMGFCMGGM